MENLKSEREKLGLSQQALADQIGVHYRTIQNWENGTKIPKSKIDFLKEFFLNYPNIKSTNSDKKSEALRKLKDIAVKRKGSSEGMLINYSNLIPVEQYIIPIKGQAGIKKAFFSPDEYIEENFEKEIVYVRPGERDIYHKIEVDGHSMPGILDPGDWARCVDIPRNTWLEKDTFKPNKVYCLFHRTLGILFKRISKIDTDRITLSSDNSDKVEYPDMEFDLMEFSKILLVKKKEVDL